jgi:hypothetical protein
MKSEECCKYSYTNKVTKETILSCPKHIDKYHNKCRLQYALGLRKTLKNRDLQKFLLQQFPVTFKLTKSLKDYIYEMNMRTICFIPRVFKREIPNLVEEIYNSGYATLPTSAIYVPKDSTVPCYIFITNTSFRMDDMYYFLHCIPLHSKIITCFKEGVPKEYCSIREDQIWSFYK